MAFVACPNCGRQINEAAKRCKYCEWENQELKHEALPIRHVEKTQDPVVLKSVVGEVQRVLTAGEEILYIALQVQGAAVARRDAVIATTGRLIFFHRPIIGGANFADFQWQDVQDVNLKQGMTASDLTMRTVAGRVEALQWLDRGQAQRVYSICQQMEQEWRERRRVRDMEEKRAAAGGTIISMPSQPVNAPVATHAPPAAVADDPVVRLTKLKGMLDLGLITEAEYQETKMRILSSL